MTNLSATGWTATYRAAPQGSIAQGSTNSARRSSRCGSSRTVSRSAWGGAVLGCVFLLGLLPSTQSLGAQTIKNKDLFGKSLGAAFQALDHFGSLDDPEELERVDDIGYAIAQASGFTDFPLAFHLIDMPEPNAFALPGGQIFLTRGMLDLGLDDDMLAGLLGHEIAHVVKSHGTRMERRALLLNILSQATMVGVIVAADRDRPTNSRHPYDVYAGGTDREQSASMIQGAYAAGVVVSELLLRSYSREFEDQADEEGQRWAAAAGYDPAGTENLMEKMGSRIPQSGAYGYWQTHPFFEQRTRAAQVRRQLLTRLEAKPSDDWRQQTQTVLLDFTTKAEPEWIELLEDQALGAWPRGEQADRIRLDRLESLREKVQAKPALSRDFGLLIKAHEAVGQAVTRLTPESPLVETVNHSIAGFRDEIDSLYPQALLVLEKGVFERSFLETFLSNYPESPRGAEARVSLGEAYARLGRQSDAVEQFLMAWKAEPETDPGRKARRGLENLTPSLSQLDALQQLAALDDEPALSKTAGERLEKIVGSYKDPANGAAYLRRFPDGTYFKQIQERQNTLADNLYGEVVLYQSVGENLKAIERIQQIFTYAPTSRAAQRLRDSMIFDA